MVKFSSLIGILSAIEEKLNSALGDSKNTSKFNKNISELESLLQTLNQFIVNEKSDKDFSQDEKEFMKRVLTSIIELEKLNKNKLGFFDSLNTYFYDSINK